MLSLYPYEKLLQATDIRALHTATLNISHALGFASFNYGAYVFPASGDALPDRHAMIRHPDNHIYAIPEVRKPSVMLLTSYPKSWMDRYVEAGYVEIDPTIKHCRNSILPLPWSKADMSSNPLLSAQLFDEARQHDLASGVTLPIHFGMNEFGLLSLASDLKDKKAEELTAATLGQAQLISAYLHESMRKMAFPSLALPTNPLSPRERECLEWAAAGKSGWEISRILSISENTVIFHFNNAKRKLDAVNRRQAIARAISNGLIHP